MSTKDHRAARSFTAFERQEMNPRADSDSRPPFYFTMDFEDIGADMLRFLDIDLSASAREDILWRTYNDISAFVKSSLGGRPVTFFCTGVLGLHAKDLIAQIAKDGNEIGCHYHYHDAVYKDAPALFDRRLGEAVEALENASNSRVSGFRAPMFSVLADHIQHYGMIANRFEYDSSIIIDAGKTFDENSYAAITNGGALRLFPITAVRKLGRIRHKPGGTFFKFFPVRWSREALAAAQANGTTPLFYVHPYEFVSDGRFRLNWSQLKPLGLARQSYWWARQTQWHTVGNGQVMGKLEALSRSFAHQGNMRDLLSEPRIGAVPTARG